MKIVKYYKHKLRCADIWMPFGFIDHKDLDLVCVFDSREKAYVKNKRILCRYTLITDIDLPSEAIFSSFASKTLRYDIRKNENENVSFKVFNSQELKHNQKILELFQDCYREMFKEKGMSSVLNPKVLERYIDADALFLTVAFCENSPTVFHSYVDYENGVRLWHSCSLFREDKETASLIGRTNKRLHYEDMVFFSKIGKKEYDWGGVFSLESNDNGIDRFKKSFGGKGICIFSDTYGISFKGKMFVFFSKLKRRFKKHG